MRRKRGELVPIGDALSGMGGPVAAIREATPQARHHFTHFDQVNQLVGARSLRGRRNPVLHVDAKCCAHTLCCGHNDPKSFYRADS